MVSLEVCCFDIHSALEAARVGAHRIELCSNRESGGLTPLLNDLITLKTAHPMVPVNVMIRSPADHLKWQYDDEAMRSMEDDMNRFIGTDLVNGFVFGFLTPDAKVDVVRNRKMIRLAEGKPCTFHKAFDEIPVDEMERELEVLIELGFNALLTSGGEETVIEGKDMLAKLVKAANGRLDIIVGGKVRSGNVGELQRETKAIWFHSAATAEGGSAFDLNEVGAIRRQLDS
jgi:copper homeostasis protein